MSEILIIYGTNHGQTSKIAQRIRNRLFSKGHSVDLFNVKTVPGYIVVKNYDAVLIGGSIHRSGYQRQLKKWIQLHSQNLNRIPSAFFSVCLGIPQRNSAVQLELRKINEDFFHSCHWKPNMRSVFAGSLDYSKYNILLKWWMRRIAAKAGGDTDTSKDYEYTDWTAVQQFTDNFSRQLHIAFSHSLLGQPQQDAEISLGT